MEIDPVLGTFGVLDDGQEVFSCDFSFDVDKQTSGSFW
jgi:hypothetical protein